MGNVGKMLDTGAAITNPLYGAYKDQKAASKAKKANNKNRNKVDQLFMDALMGTRANSARGEIAARKVVPAIQKSRTLALGQVAGSARAAQNAINDRGAAMMGDAKQQLVNRGMFNTTQLQDAQRGVNSSLDRATAEVQAALAQLTGGIEERTGAREADANRSLASWYGSDAALENAILTEYAGMLNGRQYTAGPSYLQSTMQLAGAALPFFSGGLPGGGGGAGAGAAARGPGPWADGYIFPNAPG